MSPHWGPAWLVLGSVLTKLKFHLSTSLKNCIAFGWYLQYTASSCKALQLKNLQRGIGENPARASSYLTVSLSRHDKHLRVLKWRRTERHRELDSWPLGWTSVKCAINHIPHPPLCFIQSVLVKGKSNTINWNKTERESGNNSLPKNQGCESCALLPLRRFILDFVNREEWVAFHLLQCGG